MTRYRVKIGDKEFDARLIERSAESISYEVNGKVYDVKISALKENFSSTNSVGDMHTASPVKTKAAFSVKNILAPMPGLITKILVKEGDQVKAGDALLIMEAMKMENKISSPKDAVVKKILVAAGKEVMAQEMLIELE